MRKIRASFHIALSIAGTALIAYAIVIDVATRERVLTGALGLVLLEAGVWRITRSLFPNERAYSPLRKETDFFVTLVRRLNSAAVASRRGSASAASELERVHDEMHHSVDRMLRLAGMTEEDLGFSASRRRRQPVAGESITPAHLAARGRS